MFNPVGPFFSVLICLVCRQPSPLTAPCRNASLCRRPSGVPHSWLSFSLWAVSLLFPLLTAPQLFLDRLVSSGCPQRSPPHSLLGGLPHPYTPSLRVDGYRTARPSSHLQRIPGSHSATPPPISLISIWCLMGISLSHAPRPAPVCPRPSPPLVLCLVDDRSVPHIALVNNPDS